MSRLPPVPQRRPVGAPDASRASFARQAATASLAAPLVAMALGFLSTHAARGDRVATMVVTCTVLLLILTGFVLGIVALVQTRKYGTRGILGKAVAGVCINGLLIGLILVALPAAINAARNAKELQRERLLQEEQQQEQQQP